MNINFKLYPVNLKQPKRKQCAPEFLFPPDPGYEATKAVCLVQYDRAAVFLLPRQMPYRDDTRCSWFAHEWLLD